MLQELRQRLLNGTTRSVDLVNNAIDRADAPAAAHVFTLRLDEQAREAARIADTLRESSAVSPFTGVPITIKDNIDLAGYPTTAGSTLLRAAAPATADAPVVTRLRKAGFLILGRTNMTEFAFSGLGLNPHYGTPLNPAFSAHARIPGGSSSGAGVSVSLGVAPVAIGTDTGGSVRIPAALCGVVGFKPTASTVSREGVLPLSTTLDTVGMIGASAVCCASVYSVIADTPLTLRAPPLDLRGKSFAVIENYVFDDVEDYVAQCIERAIVRLERGGAKITRLAIPALARIPAMHGKGTFAGAEAYAWHRAHIVENGAAYDPRVISRIAAAREMTTADITALHAARAQLITDVGAQAQAFDALLAPTVPVIAPRFSALTEDAAYYATNGLILRNPTIANLIDGCAISLPCHDREQAPVGLSLIGLGGTDAALLALAQTAESAISPPPFSHLN